MKIFFLSIIGIVTAVALSAKPAHAVTTRGEGSFEFIAGDQTFDVPWQTTASWQIPATLAQRSVLLGTDAYLSDPLKKLYALPENSSGLTTYDYSPKLIYAYLQTIAKTVDQPVQEPALTVEQNRATAFTPPQDGRAIDLAQATLDTIAALERGDDHVSLAIEDTKPTQSLADLNNLGIRELIARGESSFRGSPSNRRHNIKVGVEKMQGLLVAPQATFSFDDNLGPVDGEHGFLPELVIKSNSTVPEFGGGLCQVSTTTFRAAMQAGLPITARRNHAYAVQYYAPQGTDATIYPGVVDLKFINDTPGYILIWPYLKDNNTLIFDFYGTGDGRLVTVDTPTQYDRKPDGSMKATWSRTVVKDGVPRKDIFKSVYQPPALFHKQEQFVTASSTPAGFYVGPPPAPASTVR